MKEYLQDKNAGNLGDYIKHFLLIKLIEGLVRKYPNSSIAYVESHAGAGRYILTESNWGLREKFRELVCDRKEEWITFDRINSDINEKIYYGSFVLAGRLLVDTGKEIPKIILYEKDKEHGVFERLLDAKTSKLSDCDVEPFNEEATPGIIKRRIKELKEKGFQIIVCLIDPFFKSGKEDRAWCETLLWNDPGLYVLMFDVWNLMHTWHCQEKNPIKKPVEYAIKGYAIFGNSNSESLLKEIGQ